jgi:hypothetical protein
MVPDPETAARYIAVDLKLTFTGGRRRRALPSRDPKRVFRSTVSTVSHQRLHHPLQFMKRTDAALFSHRTASSHAAASAGTR